MAEILNNVGVDIQSALGTALVVTAITKANPAVVTYTAGTDPTNGTYMLIRSAGMSQIDHMVVRVANVSTINDTFECEGLNSTNFRDFVSGTSTPITFGKSFDSLLDIQMTGGEAKFTDDSDIHHDLDKEVLAGFSAFKITGTSRFEADDSALLEAQAASRARSTRCVLLKFAGGAKLAINAEVGAPLVPVANKGERLKTSLVFSAQGFPSTWSS